jgi:hypothetical protein
LRACADLLPKPTLLAHESQLVTGGRLLDRAV